MNGIIGHKIRAWHDRLLPVFVTWEYILYDAKTMNAVSCGEIERYDIIGKLCLWFNLFICFIARERNVSS